MKKANKAFTLVEILVVVIVLGILASIVVIQVDRSIVRAVERKATSDINLLNNAIGQFRASYPSVDFASVAVDDDTAFTLIRPFLGVPANIVTLEDFNRETSKMKVYEYNDAGMYFQFSN